MHSSTKEHSKVPLQAGLARRLLDLQLITEPQLARARQGASREHQSLVHALVAGRLIDSRRLAELVAEDYGLPLQDLDDYPIENWPLEGLDLSMLRRRQALPVRRDGNRLWVAISDPSNEQVLVELRFQLGVSTQPILVEDAKLSTALARLSGLEASVSQAFAPVGGGGRAALGVEEMDSVFSLTAPASGLTDKGSPLANNSPAYSPIGGSREDWIEASLDDEDSELSSDELEPALVADAPPDAPVVRYVDRLLTSAVDSGASDIHLEPYAGYLRVRLRQDGLLREMHSPPSRWAAQLIARVKVMARMDIAEHRIPQDGRLRFELSDGRDIDCRVNSLPTLHGEKLVLRLLDGETTQVPLDRLGMDAQQQSLFERAMDRPHGMILVTGPTGSGKTVSLYAALQRLNRTEINISTVEDPVEIQVPGINQVNTNAKTGLTFASALRAFLRQDPDVIMVGEIRDLETAEIAIKAAQTGHLVLSTLHTNDAPQVLSRLANMGVAAFNIASAVVLVMAQRLVRCLCPHCKQEQALPEQALREAGLTAAESAAAPRLFGPVGCDRCIEGYRGRTGIFQVIALSEVMRRLILSGGNALELEEQAAREGHADLRRSGLQLVLAGRTSLEEINRVIRE